MEKDLKEKWYELQELVNNLEDIISEEEFDDNEDFDESTSPYYDGLCEAREELSRFISDNNISELQITKWEEEYYG